MDTRAEAGYAASWTSEGTSGVKTVTEAEWLSCTKPGAMMDFLIGKVSYRKLQLYGVACCRRIWHLLGDERSRRAVETAELYLEGGATQEELYRARCRSHAAYREFGGARPSQGMSTAHSPGSDWEDWYAREILFAAYSTTCCDDPVDADCNLWCITHLTAGGRKASDSTRESLAALRAYQLVLFREIGGSPFRPVKISPTVLAWNDGTVVRLAQTAYEERYLPSGTLDNTRLAILADALEEAGCTDADILGHLREPGPHVRGCWVLDLCLGKS
jgi:hypothetical protein